ncbi:hypothetical protein F4679DRAFT_377088 [Xylaria curta]|nr:hypothetical protein F4679DRAFT_377088 [Xylaria curta]
MACLWALFGFLQFVAAQNNPNSPANADQPVGWQAGNRYRSTWSIIVDCLSTIFACTWSIQHPNVPSPQDGRLTRWLRNLKWLIITILFPEVIVSRAIFELAMAYKALQLIAQRNSLLVEWPIQLPKFPRSKQRGQAEQKSQPASSIKQSARWTLTHCYFANMGGFRYGDQNSSFPLTPLQLTEIWGQEPPPIAKEEIEDRSKSDFFAKIVASLQFLQLAISLIARTNQHLAFSQLETITLAFAVCGIFIYILYLHKPQKVETFILYNPQREEPIQFSKTYDSLWAVLTNEYGNTDVEMAAENTDRIPNDNIPISGSSTAHPILFLLAFASGLFGAFHAIAWHFEFPSTVEMIIWRVAALVATISPFVGLIIIPFAQLTRAAGYPRPFERKCLQLIREYSWHIGNEDADVAYKKLEDAFARREKKAYGDIFGQHQGGTQGLAAELLKFLCREGDFANLNIPERQSLLIHEDKDFIKDFRALVRVC